MFKPIAIKALSNYKIWIKYSDGVEGEVDLSYLAGKGVFSIWNDYEKFKNVKIGEHGEVMWDENTDLCPDSIYIKLTGKSIEELFPNIKKELSYA